MNSNDHTPSVKYNKENLASSKLSASQVLDCNSDGFAIEEDKDFFYTNTLDKLREKNLKKSRKNSSKKKVFTKNEIDSTSKEMLASREKSSEPANEEINLSEEFNKIDTNEIDGLF